MANIQLTVILSMCARHALIMLFKLPIMLLSNAPNFSLLCPNYAQMFPVMLHKLMLS